jgi:hypothetical protein
MEPESPTFESATDVAAFENQCLAQADMILQAARPFLAWHDINARAKLSRTGDWQTAPCLYKSTLDFEVMSGLKWRFTDCLVLVFNALPMCQASNISQFLADTFGELLQGHSIQ